MSNTVEQKTRSDEEIQAVAKAAGFLALGESAQMDYVDDLLRSPFIDAAHKEGLMRAINGAFYRGISQAAQYDLGSNHTLVEMVLERYTTGDRSAIHGTIREPEVTADSLPKDRGVSLIKDVPFRY